jgi:hypothetical protein
MNRQLSTPRIVSRNTSRSTPRKNERRIIAAIGAGIAAGSAAVAMLGRNHPMLIWLWLVVLVFALAFAATQLIRIKRRQLARRRPNE